jgi:radical SAM/Cys-rich protein
MASLQTSYQSSEDSAEPVGTIEPFRTMLAKHGLKLERAKTTTLQINVGLLCNQTCRHCHLEAGPARNELMDERTIEATVSFAKRFRFQTIDLTGGAPELHPHLPAIITDLAPLAGRLIVRTNLSALEETNPDRLIETFKRHRAVVIASFPALNPGQTESQRGTGSFRTSIQALKRLNAAGYGREGSPMELDLVSNPTGAFLPPSQEQAEKRFRAVLEEKWGVVFNQLYTFANVPLGRFGRWLVKTGNFDRYVGRLASHFNPCAVEGLMCRTLLSVAWDGTLYDCDFNLAKGLHMGGRKMGISELKSPPKPGVPIATADHCYTCTAGSGFT